MTRTELLALPATVDVVTAARAMSCGRTLAYQLVRAGEFPARVVRLGSRYRVVTGGPDGLLAALGIDPAAADTPPPTLTTSPPNVRPVAGPDRGAGVARNANDADHAHRKRGA